MHILLPNGITFALAADKTPNISNFYKHSHNYYEIYVFIDGDAKYIIEDSIYNLRPYDLLFIKPAQYHYLKLVSTRRYERFKLYFTDEQFPQNAAQLLMSDNQCFKIGKDSQICKLLYDFHSIIDTYSKEDILLASTSLVTNLLLQLKYFYQADESNASAGILHPVLNKILSYINANLTEPLDIKTISAALSLSPSHISHLFTKHLSIGVIQYIRQKKILKAQALIRSGIKPIIASSMCGFADYSTFFRIYNKLLGINPKDDCK